ncbi:MAG: V-type ATP synthase subunit D [Planctomycetota bacterium]
MGKVKNTKNELKAQRDALKRYQRYLPTLQLKKQQLQSEVRRVEHELDAAVRREHDLLEDLAAWVELFSDAVDFSPYLAVERIVTDDSNVAGVNVPVLRQVDWQRRPPDLFDAPLWWDDALACLEKLVTTRLERRVLDEQKRLLSEELRTTNQRVNLFERVKIPECKDAIRRIRIFLGDVQTLDVARGKIAKRKALERETAQ